MKSEICIIIIEENRFHFMRLHHKQSSTLKLGRSNNKINRLRENILNGVYTFILTYVHIKVKSKRVAQCPIRHVRVKKVRPYHIVVAGRLCQVNPIQKKQVPSNRCSMPSWSIILAKSRPWRYFTACTAKDKQTNKSSPLSQSTKEEPTTL